MTNQTILQEVLPPPIIFESRGPQKLNPQEVKLNFEAKETTKAKAHNCPQCGFEL